MLKPETKDLILQYGKIRPDYAAQSQRNTQLGNSAAKTSINHHGLVFDDDTEQDETPSLVAMATKTGGTKVDFEEAYKRITENKGSADDSKKTEEKPALKSALKAGVHMMGPSRDFTPTDPYQVYMHRIDWGSLRQAYKDEHGDDDDEEEKRRKAQKALEELRKPKPTSQKAVKKKRREAAKKTSDSEDEDLPFEYDPKNPYAAVRPMKTAPAIERRDSQLSDTSSVNSYVLHPGAVPADPARAQADRIRNAARHRIITASSNPMNDLPRIQREYQEQLTRNDVDFQTQHHGTITVRDPMSRRLRPTRNPMEDLHRQMGTGPVPEGKDRVYVSFDLDRNREPRDQMIQQVRERVPVRNRENVAVDTMYGNPPATATAVIPRLPGQMPQAASVASRPPPMPSQGPVAFYNPRLHSELESQVPPYEESESETEEATQLQAGIMNSYSENAGQLVRRRANDTTVIPSSGVIYLPPPDTASQPPLHVEQARYGLITSPTDWWLSQQQNAQSQQGQIQDTSTTQQVLDPSDPSSIVQALTAPVTQQAKDDMQRRIEEFEQQHGFVASEETPTTQGVQNAASDDTSTTQEAQNLTQAPQDHVQLQNQEPSYSQAAQAGIPETTQEETQAYVDEAIARNEAIKEALLGSPVGAPTHEDGWSDEDLQYDDENHIGGQLPPPVDSLEDVDLEDTKPAATIPGRAPPYARS